MFPEMRIGLPKPEDQDEMPPSFNEMRAAIDKGRYESAMIRHFLRQAEYGGLNSEDKYTLLAYHALRILEDTHQRLIRVLELHPKL